jgi:hypothetical protein
VGAGVNEAAGCQLAITVLNNRLTHGGEVVSLTRRPRSTPQALFFPVSATHFCQRLSKPQGLMWLEVTSSGLEPSTLRLVA